MIISNSDNDKQCDICLRTFVRTEHLTRHRRTHTKEKPYRCDHCGASFQRSDVKTAHEKACPQGPSQEQNNRTTPPRKRVKVACEKCRARKVGCDGHFPCKPCYSSSVLCRYDTILESVNDDVDATFNNLGVLGELPEYMDADVMLQLERATADSQLPTPDTFSASLTANEALKQSFDLGNMETMTSGDEMWSLPAMNNAQFWFDNDELFDFHLFDIPTQLTEPSALLTPALRLTATMQAYFEAKSRPPSPSLYEPGTKKWYSAPPDLHQYPTEILKIFLRLFTRHIPRTFKIFSDPLDVQRNHSVQYMLVIAAVGGLFSTVPGSGEIARAMYNDARRLHLAAFNLKDDTPSSLECKLETVKTSLLLGLWGLCSGDKQSYEFVEAFQGHLTHSLRDFAETCSTSEATFEMDLQTARLLGAIHIFDCYRVIIMMRPPALLAHHLVTRLNSSWTEVAASSARAAMLVDCRVVSGPESSMLASLASLGTHLWPALYSRQNQYKSDNLLVDSLYLGKPDFVDLACERWLQSYSQTSPTGYADLAVYHMMQITLHTNVTTLQMFAHSAPGSSARDPKTSTTAREIHDWVQDHHYEVASWHAEQLTAMIESSIQLSKPEAGNSLQRPTSSGTEPHRLDFEAPHVPYAIYYATLILWCKNATAPGKILPAQLRAPIVRGERILSLHRVHAASLLAHVLAEIL